MFPLHLQQFFTKILCNMNKTILTYGLISGAVAAVLMTGTSLYFKSTMDFQNGELFGYASILLSMLFVYIGTRAYRDQRVPATLSFGEGFKVALLITVISCVCYVVAWLIVYHTLMPDFMDKFIEYTLAQMKSVGATEAQISQEVAKMEEMKVMYQNPLFRAAITFLEPFPVGLLVSLVTSLVLRRKSA